MNDKHHLMLSTTRLFYFKFFSFKNSNTSVKQRQVHPLNFYIYLSINVFILLSILMLSFVIKSLYPYFLFFGLTRKRAVGYPNTELSVYISTHTSNFKFQQHNHEFNIACMYLLSVERMDWTVNVLCFLLE